MTIAVVLLAMLVFSGAKIAPKDQFFKDYIARESTTAIKGLFVILVVFRHYAQYVTLDGAYDEVFVIINRYLSQMIVAMFLFYSGYGISESFKKKGKSYISTFPIRRFAPTYCQFALAILLYFIVNLFMGKHHEPSKVLLAFTGWTSIGNSNWYMFAIFALYIITWVSFSIAAMMKQRISQYAGTALVVILSAILVFVLKEAGRPDYTFNTILLYSMGMLYSLCHEYIEKIVMKNMYIYSVCCLVMGSLYEQAYNIRMLALRTYTLWGMAFVAVIVLISMKIRIGNGVLDWFGSHVFSVYILQRIPMRILDKMGIMDTHKYVGLVFSFLSIIPLAMIFDYLTGKLVRKMREHKTVRHEGG